MTQNNAPSEVMTAEELAYEVLHCRYLDDFDRLKDDKVKAVELINKRDTKLLSARQTPDVDLEKIEQALNIAYYSAKNAEKVDIYLSALEDFRIVRAYLTQHGAAR